MLHELVRTYKRQLDSALDEIKAVTADRDQKAETIRMQKSLVTELRQDSKRYAELNGDLNVRVQGIRTVTVNEKVSSGKRGRLKGQKPNIARRPVNVDRVETVDCSACPDCGNDRLSGVTDRIRQSRQTHEGYMGDCTVCVQKTVLPQL